MSTDVAIVVFVDLVQIEVAEAVALAHPFRPRQFRYDCGLAVR